MSWEHLLNLRYVYRADIFAFARSYKDFNGIKNSRRQMNEYK